MAFLAIFFMSLLVTRCLARTLSRIEPYFVDVASSSPTQRITVNLAKLPGAIAQRLVRVC